MANVKVLAQRLRRTADDELAMTIARVFSENSLAKNATPPFGFIGDLSKLLFGTAIQEDVQKVADKVNQIITYSRGLHSDSFAHEKQFESYMSLSSKKMANNWTEEGMASFAQNLHAFENMMVLCLHALEQFTENAV
ncbi:hypothetical protein DPMN_035197 [Dreissena polymorpha]|uniref:Uncharacterized protein n=1 Tax=Dreissena polymorpha TaxID=45954 RepID=A0A9D4RMN9_DREPO|nr:hypothetical protein DPMN_035197 [Dreissena polymorpha]